MVVNTLTTGPILLCTNCSRHRNECFVLSACIVIRLSNASTVRKQLGNYLNVSRRSATQQLLRIIPITTISRIRRILPFIQHLMLLFASVLLQIEQRYGVIGQLDVGLSVSCMGVSVKLWRLFPAPIVIFNLIFNSIFRFLSISNPSSYYLSL